MTIYDALSKYLITPIYLRARNRVLLQRFSELSESQYFSADRVCEIQFKNLKKLLIHCYDKVPFYRRRFDIVGFDPLRMSDPSEIKRIPYLTKKDLQENKTMLIASNFRECELIPDASGGSTGTPTSFYKDPRRNQLRGADRMRHDMWSGWAPGEKYATLWGAQREFDIQTPFRIRMSDRYLHRVFGFNAFDISEHKVLQCLEALAKIRPSMIVAYANVAHLFAGLVQRHGIDLSGIGIKGVISSAETLTPDMRGAIESAFQTKVLNRYGSREVGLVASECEAQEGLHISAESVLVEIQKNGLDLSPGETGEIIVTDLWNYGMPFIRFQMGDLGVMGARLCSCGRGLPLLQEVTGRVSDFIVDARGGLVHGEYFTHLFYGLEGIEQFQLIQENRELITLNIHPNSKYNPLILKPVIERIKLCIGGGVQINVRLLEKSLTETSGKFRFTVSRISSGYGPLS